MTYANISTPSAQNTQRVAVTTASAATANPVGSGVAIVTVTAGCFVVRGNAPTAVAQTSMYLAPNIPYRLRGLLPEDKLAFITAAGTADAYVTPEA